MFQKIYEIVVANPNLEELVIIWVTDGQDDSNKDECNEAAKKIREHNPLLKIKYLAIGFSANHDAQRMKEVAESGNVDGNFRFVDTRGDGSAKETVEAALKQALFE